MLYFRMLIIMVVSLYTSRVVLQVLGVEDFGIYNVVGGIVAMMGLLNSAMASSIQRYFSFELGKNDIKQLSKTFSTSLLIYIILCGIFLVLAETVGLWFLNNKLLIPEERMTAANWVYQFSVLSVINTLLVNPYNASIIAHERMSIYAYVSIVEVALKLLIVYLVSWAGYDRLIMYGLLYMASSLAITMIYRIYCVRNFEECRFKRVDDKGLFWQLVRYSGWNLFGASAGLVKGQGLNILLNMFFNPAVNAARGIAYQVNGQIMQFSSNFYTAVRPQITKYYAMGDLRNMTLLAFRSSKLSYYLVLILSLPVIMEAPMIISLWLGQLPEYVVPFIRVIIIISAIDAMANPLMTIAHATGRIALYQFLIGTLTMLNIPISYCVLLYYSNPIVVFFISLVISTICLFARLWIVKRLVPAFPVRSYLYDVILKAFVVTVCAAVIPMIIINFCDSSLFLSLVDIVVCFLSTVAFAFAFGLNKDERTAVQEMVIKKIKKK